MKRIVACIIFWLICSTHAQAQNHRNYLKKFDENITPSPTVANLGHFGGANVSKNSGGISKTINLLNMRQHTLSYSASVGYASTGIRIDDWGSRVGIGWRENIGAVISRVVKGVPDELATGRIVDASNLFDEVGETNVTPEQFATVKSLAAHNTTFDGEYDVFDYNLFGKTGQFIIKNNQAELLTKGEGLKITLLSTFPYKFLITTADGTGYYFDDAIETTKFSSENACTIDYQNNQGYITTAWFIRKMVSLAGSTISFSYSDAQYSYIYDYTEFYSFTSFNNKPLPCSNGGGGVVDDDTYDGYENSKTACLRRKNVFTKVLGSVTGENFVIVYSYQNRNDIAGEKLLNNITISNKTEIIKTIEFAYDQVIATSAIETVIQDNLDNSDQSEANNIRTRYFLKALNIWGAWGEAISYQFGYQNPEILPHRFSFSKDHLGCYNGKLNAGLVPQESIQGIENLGISLPFADRSTSLVGSAGLLNKIVYPTGGRDSIVYEQNQYTAIESQDHWDWYSDNLVNNTNYNELSQDFFYMTIPYEHPRDAILTLRCYYDSESSLPHPDSEYFATVELVKQHNGETTIMPLPGRYGALELFPHRDPNWAVYSAVIPFQREPDAGYLLRVNLVGKHTALEAKFNYIYDRTYQKVTKPFVGYRVKQVLTYSKTGSNLVKSYNYNQFKIENDQVIISPDSSSLIVRQPKNFRSKSVNVCYDFAYLPTSPAGEINILKNTYAYETYRLLPGDNENINVYGGLPYAYTSVTEFSDTTDKIAFTASQFQVTPNGHAGSISIRYPRVTAVNPEMEDFAWDNGLETNRYIGTKSNDKYLIIKENKYSYSATTTRYNNYSAGVIVQPLYDQDVIGNYLINYHMNYSNWVKLDTVTEITYSRHGAGYTTLVDKVVYRYNNMDQMVEETERYDSKKNTIVNQVYRPYKMVALGLDPSGIYQGMINANFISPEIENRVKVNGQQLALESVHYSSPFAGMYLPQSIITQNSISTPLETRATFNKYDNRGNLLEKQKVNDVVESYLWGYKGQYPVAKITGKSYVDVVTQSGIDFSALDDPARVWTELNKLRSLTGCFVTTYTYKPIIGMTSQTDVNNLTTYYEYDGLGRLIYIRDHNHNILKKFCYNYQGQVADCGETP